MPISKKSLKNAGFAGGLALFIVLSAVFLFSCAGGAGGGADHDTEGLDLEDLSGEVQEPDTNTAMATGGVVAFIDNGNETWDEIHTFVYDSENETEGQTIQTLTFNTTPNLSARILVVAGGGAGGWGANTSSYPAGGGGAGGLIHKTAVTLSGSTSFPVKVGRGGNPGTGNQVDQESENGKDSQFHTDIAIGGGGGGGHAAYYSSWGHDGGSGGGCNRHNVGHGKGTLGQGHDGGDVANTTGGGGAGEAGSNEAPGNGGDGLSINITGEEVWYAGGGSSGVATAVGGRGGGGDAGKPGVNGTGGGGGGTGNGGNTIRGGDGIVIIRFPWTAP